ncbi:hypothetical protein [[Clostridium] polysaccharolyticum]|uniref:GAF domain-containing protein n=1 Tax=[Clostridium] polysaccharolyticum TaxID=29364 RepID=A0A1I0CZS9_9FIRM|nr:hypothetical protein [[Clostridium] polysaccharolyticum]SET24660.1 hypothetical protein SAMN04487772_11214 [[Clostridium] polysaccharolyticum]
MMNELLKNIIEIAPLYAKALQQDVAIGISDNEQFLALFETENLKYPFKAGTKVKDTAYIKELEQVIKTKEPHVFYIPKKVTGRVDIKSIIAPIMDNGEMVGCISLSINMEEEARHEDYSSILRLCANSAKPMAARERRQSDKKGEGEVVETLLEIQDGIVQSAEHGK